MVLYQWQPTSSFNTFSFIYHPKQKVFIQHFEFLYIFLLPLQLFDIHTVPLLFCTPCHLYSTLIVPRWYHLIYTVHLFIQYTYLYDILTFIQYTYTYYYMVVNHQRYHSLTELSLADTIYVSHRYTEMVSVKDNSTKAKYVPCIPFSYGNNYHTVGPSFSSLRPCYRYVSRWLSMLPQFGDDVSKA